jgi:hypothetical protein
LVPRQHDQPVRLHDRVWGAGDWVALMGVKKEILLGKMDWVLGCDDYREWSE